MTSRRHRPAGLRAARGAFAAAAAGLALVGGAVSTAALSPLPLPTLTPPDVHVPAVTVTVAPAGTTASVPTASGGTAVLPGSIVVSTGATALTGAGGADSSAPAPAPAGPPAYQPSADERQSLPDEPDRLAYEQQQSDVIYDTTGLLDQLSPIAVGAGGGSGRFGWPVVVRGRPPITQRFGCSDLAGEPYKADCPSRRWHTGIDLGEPEGTPVFASDAGVVRTFRSDRGYGNYALVVHGNGYSTLYGHLRDFVVRDGTVVGRGDPIGLVGSTGFSTGPHLHFEIRYEGGYLDPCAELRC